MTDPTRSKGLIARLGRLYHRQPIPILRAAAIGLGTIFALVTPLFVRLRRMQRLPSNRDGRDLGENQA